MFRSTAPVAAIALAVCAGLGAAVAAAPAALAVPRTAAQNVNAPSVAAGPPPGGGGLWALPSITLSTAMGSLARSSSSATTSRSVEPSAAQSWAANP